MVIEAKGIIKNYKGDDYRKDKKNKNVKVLKGIDLTIEEKDFVGIMGRSGCGKTTLLKVLGLIEYPTSGEILFKGQNVEKLDEDRMAEIKNRDIGFIFQDFYLMASLSVQENIMLPMILSKENVKLMVNKCNDLAKILEIDQLLKRYPDELSGGEKQRVAICRAIINDPNFILADEPTGSLDSKSGRKIINILEKINKELGKTIITVTHDPIVASYCNKVIFMKDGKIIDSLVGGEDHSQFYQEILKNMEYL